MRHPCLALLGLLALGLPAVAQSPPNVVVIYADDLGYGDLASYGHPRLETPALDELARQGMRLTSYYAPAPLCSPSRAGLLTGRTPARTGVESWIPAGSDVELGANETTLATLFRRHGYRTFLSGKWHLNGGPGLAGQLQPDDHGFDRWLALHGWPIPNNRDPVNFHRDGVALGEVEGYTGSIVVDQAIEWLEAAGDSAPFFLYLAMIEPHSLIANPAEYNAKYADLTRGRVVPFENPLSAELPPPDDLAARGPGEYLANITYMDAQIGRFLEWLEANGLAEETLVVFTSDNGAVTTDWRRWWEVNLYGDTGGLRGRKGDLYEGGIRVPAIVRWPGRVPAGTASDVPVYGLDWLPTLASLAGFEAPADRPIDGEDVAPLLLGEPFARRSSLYWQFPDHNGLRYALRRGRWKLLADEALERVHLYDLESDPFELQDAAGRSPEVLAELLAELEARRDDVATDPVRAARASRDDRTLLVSGGTVVTVDAADRVIADGAVAIVDGGIVAVGPRAEVEADFPDAERLDAEGGLIVPGLINGHTHAPMVLFRGLVDDLELMEWLEDYIFPAEAEHVDEDFVRWGTRLACLEMLAGGTTTFVDMYYFDDVIAEEAERCGMRAIVGETLIDFPAPDNATWEEAVAYTRRFVERWKGHPRITPAVAPHSAYTVSGEHLVEAHRLAVELDVPLLTHLAEDPSELERVSAATGHTSIDYLAELGVLDERLVAAHVVVPTAGEIERLAARGVGVVHCPQSNLKVGAGVAPVTAMAAAGVAVGLGTDGAGSNNDLSLWEEVDTAAKLQKLALGDPTALDARSAFRMATLEGARALDMAESIGSLEVGKRGDVVVVAADGWHQLPQDAAANPYSFLVYSTKAADVRAVVVEGRVVVRDGRVLTLDADAVRRNAARLRRALAAVGPADGR